MFHRSLHVRLLFLCSICMPLFFSSDPTPSLLFSFFFFCWWSCRGCHVGGGPLPCPIAAYSGPLGAAFTASTDGTVRRWNLNRELKVGPGKDVEPTKVLRQVIKWLSSRHPLSLQSNDGKPHHIHLSVAKVASRVHP